MTSPMERLAGIPGTVSLEAKHIQWIRQKDTSTGERVYAAVVPDGHLRVLVSHDEIEPGKRLWHISVSHWGKDELPDRCPNWDELKQAAYRLIQPDICLILIFPRRSAPYVDLHPTTLHLWESDKEIDLG